MRFVLKATGRVGVLAAALLAVTQLAAQAEPNSQPPAHFDPAAHNLPASANALVREVIDNQLKQTNEPRCMYRVRRETPSGVQTKEVIETTEGSVSWVLTKDDHPLNDDQRRKEDSRLEDLLKNPDQQAKQRKEAKEDDDRTRKMLQAMPDAFIYTYDGVEPTHNGAGELVRLSFKANPAFKAPDRETQVYRGMNGHMLIHPTERRMVKIDATLVDDVNFGWGIFGRLNKGGRFVVEQSRIMQNRWDTTDMLLDFTGKILLFKKLRIKEHEVSTDFRPIPQNLSLREGIQMLRKQATQLAEKKKF